MTLVRRSESMFWSKPWTGAWTGGPGWTGSVDYNCFIGYFSRSTWTG